MLGRYHERVASALLPNDHGPRVEALVVCLPSFEPEWAVYLRGKDGEGYTVTVAETEKSIWEGSQYDPDLPAVNRKTIEVTPEFAGQMREAFVNLLCTVANTNYRSMGCDGIEYHFVARCKELRQLSGQTWSPQPSTTAGRFVYVLEQLRAAVLQDGADASELEKIEEAFRQFDTVPRYYVENETTVGVLRSIEQSKKIYSDETITDTEFVNHVNDTFRHHGYPPLADLIRLVRLIPDEIQERILKQSQPQPNKTSEAKP